MLKKINDILAGVPMTAVGGIFLVLSFVLPRIGAALPVDPAWITVVISGIPLLYLAVWRVIHNPGISKISSALLITIAMFAAIAIGDLFAAGEVVFIMAIGAILEDMTTERARKGLKQLISLAPVQGRRVENGQERMIPAQEIRSGDLLRILPGETVPVDGVIVSGETSVDQSIMTGESLPVDKSVGEEVFCGTVNRFGAVDIHATKVGQDSSLQKLIRMVQEAEEKKAPMARIADKAASFLVPVALLIAIAAGLVTGDIVRAVTVLVVFCPCALVLATPTAVMAAIGQATKHGVIVKSGEALEKMGKVDTIAFDKTGTLTCGCLEVSDILPFDSGLSENELLRLTASAESRSEHPLAKAITACAESRSVKPVEPEAFHMDAGKGICAQVSGRKLYCGSEKYLTEHGFFPGESVKEQLERLRSQGKASILIAEELIAEESASEKTTAENSTAEKRAAADGRCIGIIAMSDVLREEAADMIRSLNGLHTDTVLLTGDSRQTADWFAKRVGINEVHAELLPEEKVAMIEKMQAEGRTVCMIGDGVNDAPALKTAGVGVAMGSMGSDIAVEAADIALMSDD
ncbi:MAG: heavy metal translocating P-type ATPase, partial [Lachnospiraceae bacterium]